MSSKPFFRVIPFPFLDPKPVQGCSSGALMADGLANNMMTRSKWYRMDARMNRIYGPDNGLSLI